MFRKDCYTRRRVPRNKDSTIRGAGTRFDGAFFFLLRGCGAPVPSLGGDTTSIERRMERLVALPDGHADWHRRGKTEGGSEFWESCGADMADDNDTRLVAIEA